MERLIALAWKTFWVALGASLVVVFQSVVLVERSDRAAVEPAVSPASSTYVPFSPTNPALTNGGPTSARTVTPPAKKIVVPAISRLSSRASVGPLG